ncbi:hypothetical protein [Roseisolibacter agri]|uniref:hypothetical protein n=1 Tax=Roseisolibacter agri TaxID=2014610 RepID=UPI0024E0835C|nr:hypothetical protein [Roseisolibacter agri]
MRHRFNLPETFDLESFENRVPTTRRFNNAKGNRTTGVWEAVIRHGLDVAAAHAARVQEQVQQLILQDREERARRVARLHHAPPGRPFSARMPWPIRTDLLGEDHVRVWLEDVYLDCFLPSPQRFRGSALLLVAAAGMGEYQSTFDHGDVVETVLAGRETPLDRGRRPLLLAQGAGPVTLRLPSAWLQIRRDHAARVCAALDTVAHRYVRAMRRLELDVLHSAGAAVGAAGTCRLLTVQRSLWRAINAFAEAGEEQRGPAGETWTVMGSRGFGVFTSAGHAPRALRARVAPEAGGSVLDATDDPDVHLCWHPPEHDRASLEDDLRAGHVWTVAETQAWLRDTLIPHVMRWADARELFVQRESMHKAPRLPWHRSRVVPITVRRSPHVSQPTPTLPPRWESIRDDFEQLAACVPTLSEPAEWSRDVDPAAVGRLRALLAGWVTRGWIPRTAEPSFLHALGAPDLSRAGLTLAGTAPAAASATARQVFAALHAVTRGAAAGADVTSARAARELADALAPFYARWWESHLRARVWTDGRR